MPYVQRTGKPALSCEVDDFTDPWASAPVLTLLMGASGTRAAHALAAMSIFSGCAHAAGAPDPQKHEVLHA